MPARTPPLFVGTGGAELRSVGERLLRCAGAAPEATTAAVLQGPGGMGKSLLLTELAAAHGQAGRPVTDAAEAPDPADVDGEIAVVVDDAHTLSEGHAARVRALIGHPDVRIALACRPWPRPRALTTLLEALGSDRRLLVLGHLTRPEVAALAYEQLGDGASPGLVDLVLTQTGGLPALVHALLRGLGERRARFGDATTTGRFPHAQPDGVAVPEEVMDRVRADLLVLPEETRAVLHAVAVGAPVDAEVVAELHDRPLAWATDRIREARASGLLLADGSVVRLSRRALLEGTPADVTRSCRQRLLGLLLERGEEPLQLVRDLAADGVRDARAARLLERHGSTGLSSDAGHAAELFSAAVRCGASPLRLAARHAYAAALAGDLDTAVRAADTVLTNADAPDKEVAAGVAAAVHARRGMIDRCADLCRLAGDERAGSTALALLVTGHLAEAEETLEQSRRRAAHTSLSASEELMADGLLRSVQAGADAGTDLTAALSMLMRAAALLEPGGRTALLLDTPAALAALVALHSGELSVADSVLRRALEAGVGGPIGRARHLALLAWVAMQRGRLHAARGLAADARAAAHGRPEPRDDLFLEALTVGLARRSSDAVALATAWPRAREALLRHPIDLLTLLPLGELLVAAARLRETEHLDPHVTSAQELLDRLGSPPLWSTSLHWSGAQAAIVSDDKEGLKPHAAALVAAARTSPYAATLARSGRCWLMVLAGDIDATAVQEAAEGLAAVGLSWDGSRLAGQAAARSSDARSRTLLLQCARGLSEEDDTEPSPTVPSPRSESSPGWQLSQREREVAELLIEGQTYREVGGRLFISAKTVEHHVARIRQRLGASNRSDLLARLRAELAHDG